MAHYIGIIHKDENTDYGVCFPDFPGCITAGSTMEELVAMAKEALEFHMQGMVEDGERLPQPMSLKQAKAHEFAEDADAFVVIEAQPPSKPVRVNVMLDSAVLAQISRVSKNRSEFLNEAAREKLGLR